MKKHIPLIAASLLFIHGCTQFAGEQMTMTFDADTDYTALHVEDAIDVSVSNNVDRVTVTAGEHVMPNVIVETIGDKLKIGFRKNFRRHGSEISVILPYNSDLKSIDLSNASEYHSDLALKGTDVEVRLSGASELCCDIEAIDVKIDASGASSVKSNVKSLVLDIELSGASEALLEGYAGKLTMDLSGASDIVKKVSGNRYALSCGECEVALSGASDAYIHCDGNIKVVSLTGASGLHYTGDASVTLTAGGVSDSSDIDHDVLQ
jgi:hypothetical protein